MAEVYKIGSQKLQERINELKSAYVNFVSKNPETIDQIEKTVKAASYILEALTTNYETSIFISEFVSSACNLFAYANSILFLKSKQGFPNPHDAHFGEKIKQVLTIIEFSQAFIEISARKIGGSGAKWAVISLICLVKAILRCLLIFVFKTGIQSPSLTNLMKPSTVHSSTDNENETEEVYIGSRTGHKMKTLNGFSSSSMWSSSGTTLNSLENLKPTPLESTERIGECLHAIKPLIHVLASGACGTKSFLPWLTALVIDSSSHVLLQRASASPTYTQPPYNQSEKTELRRRYANLLLYLLRSPIYDKYTESKLIGAITFLSQKLPFGRIVLEPLSRYIPEWQKVYFYTWTD